MGMTLKAYAEALAGSYGIFPTFRKVPDMGIIGRDESGTAAHNAVRKAPTNGRCESWFSRAQELAVWCGGYGGLQCIDFDDVDAYPEWVQLLKQTGLEDILSRAAVARTGHGWHVWCLVPGCTLPSRKLASFAAPQYSPARGKNVTERIEVRGEGGYAILPPSPGYEWVSGELSTLMPITEDELDALTSIAQMLDLTPPVEPLPQNSPPKNTRREDGGTPSIESPGDYYNRVTEWASLLSEAGARPAGHSGERALWTRPHKERGVSATTGNGHSGQDLLKIHTSNWPPFDAGECVSKFAFVARAKHGGDYSAAARAIAQSPGYRAMCDATRDATHNATRDRERSGGGFSVGEWEAGEWEAGEWEASEWEASSDRPVIEVADRQLRDISQDALDALAASNDPPRVFLRGGAMTRIERNEYGAATARPLCPASMRGVLSRCADWIATGGRGSRTVFPPKDVVADILTLGIPPRGIPPLIGLSSCPMIADSGRITTAPGYDPETQWYLADGAFDGLESPFRNAQSSADFLLEDMLADFPFDSDASRANALGLLLLPFLRPAISGPTPLHLAGAPKAGTGKTLLIGALLLPALGRVPAATPMPDSEDELKKTLLAMMVEARQTIVLDNLEGTIKSPSLAAYLTSTDVSGRVLGGSSTYEGQNRAIWCATANNVVMNADLARRSVSIRLDAKREDPSQGRTFRHPDLYAWIKSNRLTIVAAVLSILRAWHDAGRPIGVEQKGGYESYCRVLGGVLAVAGVRGFLANDREFRAASNESESEWRALVAEWWQRYGTESIIGKDVRGIVSELEILGDVLGEAGERSQSTRLGKALGKRVGQVFDIEDPTKGEEVFAVQITMSTPAKGVSRFKLQKLKDV
ncbi:MAG: hypothetical protein C4320_00485 [Armatimonadota bacterium]